MPLTPDASKVKLLKDADRWTVIARGTIASCANLDQAVDKALLLAERDGIPIELGAGVPSDALERGRVRRAHPES